jgi:hypothetical protein
MFAERMSKTQTCNATTTDRDFELLHRCMCLTTSCSSLVSRITENDAKVSPIWGVNETHRMAISMAS